jgi:putative salt-induced outer membrane protein
MRPMSIYGNTRKSVNLKLRKVTMKQFKLVAIAAAVAACSSGAALAQGKPDGLWHGAIGASAAVASGNTRSTSLNVSADAARATEADKWSIYATALYGKSKIAGRDTTTADLFKVGTRYDWNINKTLFAFGALDLEKDGVRELDLRSSLAGGIGAHVINDATTTFDVFAGVGFGRDKFKSRSVSGGEALLGEESAHKLSETMTFKQRFVYYPSFKDAKSDRATFDAQLSAAINKNWNLTTSLSTRWIKDVGPGVKKTDTLFLTGVSTKF